MLNTLEETLSKLFCIVSTKPIDEKWATCYNCDKAIRITSHVPIGENFLNTLGSLNALGVCVQPQHPTNKVVAIISFKRREHIVLCLKCLGDSFLAIDGDLYTRCSHCLKFFSNEEPNLNCCMGWDGYLGSDYDLHITSCKLRTKKYESKSKTNSILPFKYRNIKPFLLRKDQIK